ncbi:class I SAM-dependent methyltransferase [Gilvibacter sp.]|jgi:SAM-dependent methyltransferase|uniref:class I SAM-dependent methyltransferase n=1 Tax=Gilvibacter sp. TaxID=2729997 RepID=UPI003B5254FF
MKKLVKLIFLKLGFKISKVNNSLEVVNSVKKVKKAITPQTHLNGSAVAPYSSVPFAGETLQQLCEHYEFNTVLDIGSGEGKHSDVLNQKGKLVTAIDFGSSVYFEKRSDTYTCIISDYYEYEFDTKFDAIWASHVLEHQPNPNQFLKKIHKDLKEGGILAITVPPLKHEIVGGHVTLWNAGVLMYQLVMAGFNCRDISIKSYGYNISVILRKKTIDKYPELSYDKGDLLKLGEFLPEGLGEPFNGQIESLNWHD